MRLAAAPAGLRGFDCNTPVGQKAARVLQAAGYRFAARYIRRVAKADNDLSRAELELLHCAGLAVSPVQHVESALSWTPTDDKAKRYGEGAAAACMELDLPGGVTVWLDLEGVAAGVPDQAVISYCNLWHEIVASAGYLPGIYVGWHARLDATQLYHNLRFTRYWSAYNLNADRVPAVRGVCMKQGTTKSPVGVTFQIDTDLVARDSLGDVPTFCVPEVWDL